MKMRRGLLTVIVFLTALFNNAGTLYAQEPVDRAVIAKIRDEGLNRSRVHETFAHFTEVIGPRLTASPAYKTAAEWARDKLKELGLENPRLEAWEFGRGWTLEKFTFEMVEPRYMPLIGYPEAWSPSTAGELVAAPMFLGGKPIEAVEQMRGTIKGAIVMSQPIQTSFEREDRPQPTLASGPVAIGQPRPPGRTTSQASQQNVTRIVREAGAGVVLRPNRGEHGTLFVLGRDTGEGAVPSVVLSAEHYNMIARMIERGLAVKLRVNVQTRFLTDDKNGYNVIAELPGTDPAMRHEVVMLGGHLDSWHSSTGATDNADGAAVVMEAMRILKAIGARPKRTIRMALWGGEEEGLLGSKKYAERYLMGDANQASREKFSVYLNIDPGTGPIYGFYLEDNEAVKPIFDAWLEPFRDLGARRNIIQGIGATDHLSFIRAGVPGFNPVQDYVNYDVRTHHTNMDTFERVREADLRQAAIVMASFIYHASVRQDKIPRGKN
ncbi:MAG: M20/M25/M40 family metallo-hydrolase [Acidobacteriota bacterium]